MKNILSLLLGLVLVFGLAAHPLQAAPASDSHATLSAALLVGNPTLAQIPLDPATLVAPTPTPAPLVVADANAVTIQVPELFAAAFQKFPWLATVLTVIGGLRLLAKPAFSLAHSLADSNPNEKRIVDGVESSPITKTVLYLLDWFGSIKIKKPV